MKYSGWPDSGELVVGEVDEITDFGVFVDLEEYEDKRGLCHISEVANGWIKNVRDHVREGQTVVAKVLEVDTSSQQIDLSIKDVNEHQRKEKIQEWKNEQKADKWMSIAFGEDVSDEEYGAVANAVLVEYETLYDGFEQAAIHGAEALEDTDLDEDEVEAIVETARDNVSVPYVNVTGYVDLRCPTGDGVDHIKEALKAAEGDDAQEGETQLEVTYVGAPEYRIKVQAPDYKSAETALEDAAGRAEDSIVTAGGTALFHRERTEDDE
ncbi:translation initiation factor IF-2 subunit alpha [Halogeometricum pallidum JCM 14848]|uniref:Translation initiation factor 2 subunit alpha n=1 Tax=Halogeometricum pallidum JCM 14848 TaxID=1227487 RepID=M0CV78_HALPD|nr:translation initiation factor IF-2 subunit alpha [Halogeometricum pallidum]ELZ27156.1 translation initiation factor IF-2 subunit alpha [Halogeometricum pallidum JCM 14848]